MCLVLLKIVSDDKCAITVSIRIFDILRWRLGRGSKRSSSNMSGNLLCIINLELSENYLHFDRESMGNLSLKSSLVSPHTFLFHLFSQFSHQLGIFFLAWMIGFSCQLQYFQRLQMSFSATKNLMWGLTIVIACCTQDICFPIRHHAAVRYDNVEAIPNFLSATYTPNFAQSPSACALRVSIIA